MIPTWLISIIMAVHVQPIGLSSGCDPQDKAAEIGVSPPPESILVPNGAPYNRFVPTARVQQIGNRQWRQNPIQQIRIELLLGWAKKYALRGWDFDKSEVKVLDYVSGQNLKTTTKPYIVSGGLPEILDGSFDLKLRPVLVLLNKGHTGDRQVGPQLPLGTLLGGSDETLRFPNKPQRDDAQPDGANRCPELPVQPEWLIGLVMALGCLSGGALQWLGWGIYYGDKGARWRRLACAVILTGMVVMGAGGLWPWLSGQDRAYRERERYSSRSVETPIARMTAKRNHAGKAPRLIFT